MALPRSTLVCVADTAYYHCTNRCVRRAFLCGEDPVTRTSFSHRREWFIERLALLVDVFAIDLCAYAIMSNHYHLVLRLAPENVAAWREEDVIDRWSRVFKVPPLLQRFRNGETLIRDEHICAQRTISIWRERLASLSWFERCLNEHIARRANAEDGCTGRFWEGRFSSQALLDDPALLAAMTYVDLNPVRAGMANTLEDSEYTSIHQRLAAVDENQRSDRKRVAAPRVVPFAHIESPDDIRPIPCSWLSYLDLVEVTGRSVRDDQRRFPSGDTPKLLNTLGIVAEHWLLTVTQLRQRFQRALGSPVRLRDLAARSGQRWVRGQCRSRVLYATCTA